MTQKLGKIAVLAALIAHAGIAFSASDAAAATRSEIKRMVVEEAMNSRVPPSLALAVAKTESDFQDNALSKAGARGVMQIMPATARGEFGVDADELWDPRLNIQLGIDFLERLYDQYGGKWELALSHYNGGTLRGKGADATPHYYTRNYVTRVLNLYQRYKDQSDVWRVATRDDEPGWKPARTKIEEAPVVQRIVVRELPSATVTRWRPAEDIGGSPRLDDLPATASRHRFPTGGLLDDFTRKVTWRDS